MSMNGTVDIQQQNSHMKRRWQDKRPYNNNNNDGDHQHFNSAEFYAKLMGAATIPRPPSNNNNNNNNNMARRSREDDLVARIVPQVTVVLEGRSICQRISLDKQTNYQSLAKALREMFVDEGEVQDKEIDLSNAVPGHVIAYEDMENDLLLVGDLNYRDFVRVAKRIRILPVKENSRKAQRGGSH